MTLLYSKKIKIKTKQKSISSHINPSIIKVPLKLYRTPILSPQTPQSPNFQISYNNALYIDCSYTVHRTAKLSEQLKVRSALSATAGLLVYHGSLRHRSL